jgi:hypothetical protein
MTILSERCAWEPASSCICRPNSLVVEKLTVGQVAAGKLATLIPAVCRNGNVVIDMAKTSAAITRFTEPGSFQPTD